MAEIRHLENRHDVIIFCRGWSGLDKISQTGAEWHVDCGDMVKIETRCRIPIWQTFGRIQCHVIPEPPARLQGTATWRIQCYDPRATCHIVGCCHRANSMACHPRATCHFAGYYYCHYHDPSRRAGAGGKGHLPPTFSASGASNMVCPLLISTNFD